MRVLRPLHAALLLIAAAAITGPVTALYLSRPQLAGSVPDAPTLARFETMAENACRCLRGRKNDAEVSCWAEFDKATAPYAPSSVYSMCMDDSESLCFGMGDGIVTDEVAKRIKCISVNRSGSGVCTEADARAAAKDSGGMDC